MDNWALAWWVWILIALLLTLVEITTPGGFYFLFFGIGATVVGLVKASGLIENPTAEWLLFSLISVLALLFFRRPLLRQFHVNTSPESVDTLIGETALAVDNIPASGFGKVELRGTAWNAHNTGDRELTPGQRCKVERVDGLSLWVRPQ